MCKLKAFCLLIPSQNGVGCLYDNDYERSHCRFALAVLHRDSYVLINAHGQLGEILVKPSSFVQKTTGRISSLSKRELINCFETRRIDKLPSDFYSSNKMLSQRRIEREQLKAMRYQRDRTASSSNRGLF